MINSCYNYSLVGHAYPKFIDTAIKFWQNGPDGMMTISNGALLDVFYYSIGPDSINPSLLGFTSTPLTSTNYKITVSGSIMTIYLNVGNNTKLFATVELFTLDKSNYSAEYRVTLQP